VSYISKAIIEEVLAWRERRSSASSRRPIDRMIGWDIAFDAVTQPRQGQQLAFHQVFLYQSSRLRGSLKEGA
jgi:hypothetical protein